MVKMLNKKFPLHQLLSIDGTNFYQEVFATFFAVSEPETNLNIKNPKR